MRWKPFITGCAVVAAVSVVALATARGPAEAEADFDPVLDNRGFCIPADRSRSALQVYLAAAQRKTEIGPFDRQAVDAPEAGAAEGLAPLLEGLGSRTFRITTSNRLAQRYFDQGLTLAYAFNHAEARRAFRAAQALDPECAMCFWGEALVLGPNINLPMSPVDAPAAYYAVHRAAALAGPTGPKEQALIKALAARYSPDGSAERAPLDAGYADAMERVQARFPWDREISVLYVEALMNLSPWDYWEPGGAKPKGRTHEIVTTLERVLASGVDHPGAIHYYIHVVEASSSPERAERYADRLGELVPGAGHLVHMPFHIYFRVGRYRDALEVNRRAVAADERYFAQAGGADGVYRFGYHPHNIHSLLAAAQMAGDGTTAIEAAGKLSRSLSDDVTRAVPWVQPIMAAPYFAHAQFSDPATILAVPAPQADFPYVTAMWHYMRGVAHVASGDLPAARAAIDAIARLERSSDIQALAAAGVAAGNVMGIARHVLAARIAQSKGELADAVAELERAVAIEDNLAYSEPPFWYYPVRQSLGGALVLAGELDRAESVFRASLARQPHNGWALYGLTQVYVRKGDARAAISAQKRFDAAWAGPWSGPDLARM
ncbi:MAG TPA: tetratricopeptide repeat protein [Burkholderiales bacterium]|nr:tetratricopeptide repeat protein [Burkholderiales bacterium]